MGLSSHPQREGRAAFNSALSQSGFALCFLRAGLCPSLGYMGGLNRAL